MISKEREFRERENPEFSSDRSYALAMCFRATAPRPMSMLTVSGLARIKNVGGNLEYPSEPIPPGFVLLGKV